MELNKIYNESNLDTMARMPDNFIDLTVTSPPYDGLRLYNGFSFPFEDIAKELYRVTKPGGVVVWVVGDSTTQFNETLTSFKQALYFQGLGFGIETMIYQKECPTWNESSKRYRQDFEYIFIINKGTPKTFNPLKDVRVNNLKPRKALGSRNGTRHYEMVYPNEFTVRSNIFKYVNGYGRTAKDDIAYKHPAIFPEQLAADQIYTWSNEGDIVYDCFGGSGTTAKMAHLQKRNWILSEISSEYVELAEKRIAPYLAQMMMF